MLVLRSRLPGEQVAQRVDELKALNAQERQKRTIELRASIQLLMEVARKIRKQRMSQGALELESAEVTHEAFRETSIHITNIHVYV